MSAPGKLAVQAAAALRSCLNFKRLQNRVAVTHCCAGLEKSGVGSAGEESWEKRIAIFENRLESIAEAVRVTVEANAVDDDVDRKRLKERLREDH